MGKKEGGRSDRKKKGSGIVCCHQGGEKVPRATNWRAESKEKVLIERDPPFAKKSGGGSQLTEREEGGRKRERIVKRGEGTHPILEGLRLHRKKEMFARGGWEGGTVVPLEEQALPVFACTRVTARSWRWEKGCRRCGQEKYMKGNLLH